MQGLACTTCFPPAAPISFANLNLANRFASAGTINVGADQVIVVLGRVLALQERIMEQLTRDRAQQQRQLETRNARFETLVLRLQMCRVPDFPGVQPEIRSPQSDAGARDGAVGSVAHAAVVSPEAPEPGVSATSSGSGDPYGSDIAWPPR